MKKEANLVTKITNHDEYMRFIARPESSQLYHVEPWKVGLASLKEINLEAHPMRIVDIGKKVTKNVLGIGIKNENNEMKLINIDKINEIRSPKSFTGGD